MPPAPSLLAFDDPRSQRILLGTRENARATGEQWGAAMLIASVLRAKGTFVATIEPDRTVADLLDLLRRHNVGAMVVSADGLRIDGVVSERDVVRHMSAEGPPLLGRPVSAIMTPTVRTCTSNDSVEDVMRVMTRERIRHVPVVDQGALVGIVSIGDVVKNRVDELEGERDDLIKYISQ
jgi:CBS domain-containing protein